MQKGLSNSAIILLLTMVFFVLIMQRLMISNEVSVQSDMSGKGLNVTRVSVLKTVLPPVFEPATMQPLVSSGNIKFGSGHDQPLALLDVLEQTPAPTLRTEVKVALVYSPPTRKPVTSTLSVSDSKPAPVVSNHITFLDIPTKKPVKERKLLELMVEPYVKAHPYVSPRPGSDISPAAQTSLLLCPNQTKCIVPELQLQKKYKVYMCKKSIMAGGRFYFLVREGLLLHPNVELVSEESMHQANYVVYLPGSSEWQKTECNDTRLVPKMIVLDEFDGHSLIAPGLNSTEFKKGYGKVDAQWYYMYFKRSFVRRSDGKFEGYPHLVKNDAYPITYSVAEAYVDRRFNQQREIEIFCTLRGSKHMTTRLRVQEWVAEYGKKCAVKNIVTAQVTTIMRDRARISNEHFQNMYNSQIIVTVNPANSEGDFRLWEAMGSGALIFVDPVFVPHPYPLVDGVNVVYFSNTNKTELFAKLDYYRKNKDIARRIAINGYLHAMKYHRTVNMIDYVFRSVHLKEAMEAKVHSPPHYSFTGQYLNQEAKIQLEMIKQCQYPGIYEDPILSTLGVASGQHTKRLQCAKKPKLSGTNIEFM